MIVVDTNIIAYLLIDGEKTALARELSRRESIWAVPSFWRIEFLNVLMNYSKFHKLPAKDVHGIWRSSFLLPNLREEGVEPAMALEAALSFKITGYDALFVSLAQSLKTVCVSQDRDLQKAVPKTVVSMEKFLE